MPLSPNGTVLDGELKKGGLPAALYGSRNVQRLPASDPFLNVVEFVLRLLSSRPAPRPWYLGSKTLTRKAYAAAAYQRA